MEGMWKLNHAIDTNLASAAQSCNGSPHGPRHWAKSRWTCDDGSWNNEQTPRGKLDAETPTAFRNPRARY